MRTPTAYSFSASITSFLGIMPFIFKLGEVGKSKKRLEHILAESRYSNLDVNPVQRYKILNEETLKRLGKLKGKKLILTNPISPNLLFSEAEASGRKFPNYVFIDQFSSEFRQSDALLLLALQSPKAYKEIVFMPASPVILPMAFEDYRFVHIFPDAIQSANLKLESKFPENLERKLLQGSSKVLYEARETAFDIDKAKAFVGANLKIFDKEIAKYPSLEEFFISIEYEVYLKTAIYAELYKKVIEAMQPSSLLLFAKKTSFIRDKVFRRFGIKFIELDIMRNSEISPFAELEPSALNILDGYIKSIFARQHFMPQKSQESATIETQNINPKPSKAGNLSNLLFESCPNHDFSFYLCEESRLCMLHPQRNRQYCPYDYFQTFKEEERNTLSKRAKEKSYSFASGVADIFFLLHGKNFALLSSNGEYTTIQDQLHNFTVFPLIYKPSPKQHTDLRASSFYSKCAIAVILEHLNLPKLENETIIAGRAMHKLKNTTPKISDQLNYLPFLLFDLLGIDRVRYEDFCENLVTYKTPSGIIISGRPDMALGFGAKEHLEGIIIFDFKSGMIKRKGYRHQLMVYGLALANKFDAKKIIGINFLRHYDGDFGQDFKKDYRLTRYHGRHIPIKPEGFIASVTTNDAFVRELDDKAQKILTLSNSILKSREEYEKIKKLNESRCPACIYKVSCLDFIKKHYT